MLALKGVIPSISEVCGSQGRQLSIREVILTEYMVPQYFMRKNVCNGYGIRGAANDVVDHICVKLSVPYSV